jgi:hypothetical protein
VSSRSDDTDDDDDTTRERLVTAERAHATPEDLAGREAILRSGLTTSF